MNKLPMSFDWKKAKENGQTPISPFAQTPIAAQGMQMNNINSLNYNSDVHNSAELVQSIIMHINNQVKTTTDLDGYAQCGKNPYAYVATKFVNNILMPYLVQHRIDSNGIMYIATSLKQDPDSNKFINADGLLNQAIEYEDHVEIAPQVILKVIIDKCM